MENNNAFISSINGSVVKASGNRDLKMLEMVMVGNEKLIGEVIGIKDDTAIVQVYENTTGLSIGEPVYSTSKSMSVTLGPGIIGNIFDGIERPLTIIKEKSGAFIERGLVVDSIDKEKKWQTKINVKAGGEITGGTIIGEVVESSLVVHKIMAPPNTFGVVTEAVLDGEYSASDILVKYKDKNQNIKELTMVQEWPIRIPRPTQKRMKIAIPLITGQRVIDSLFPIAKGGTATIPGGFGTGKTMTQHQFAKWSDADIIVYIGCGERGNEMTQVLEDFSHLVDPKSGKPLMDRTVLIANTSNMPVAAREASIYTGVTIAEYYRDMGYNVAIMADSTSRWAEALREISGRLEEMPAEEGFPAYLSSRLSEFYERAGYFINLNQTEGSVSIIGAVSPQGGDFSEPVTQNTKRFVRGFLALDRQLAYSRHYPAINWLTSYSEYIDDLSDWYEQNVDQNFFEYRKDIMRLLNEESKLMEIVKLIGGDVLPDEQKLILDITRVIRLGFLQQNAYHMTDTYVPLLKQFKMMEVILNLFEKAKILIGNGIPISVLRNEGIFEDVIKIKYEVSNDNIQKLDDYKTRIDNFYQRLIEQYKNSAKK